MLHFFYFQYINKFWNSVLLYVIFLDLELETLFLFILWFKKHNFFTYL